MSIKDSEQSPESSNWYEKAFGSEYLKLYAHRDQRDAQRAVDFVAAHAGVRSSDCLLDLCCGAGRHLALLAPQVKLAFGLDLSRPLLSRTIQALPAQSSAAVVESDMRILPFRSARFDLVLNLFTSFGYFEDDAQNQAVINEVARLLKPGGRFVHDHINRTYLLANLVPESTRKLENGTLIKEERVFDDERSRIVKSVEWTASEGTVDHWTESVRVYRPEEIQARLEQAGLVVQAQFGNFDGSTLCEESPRMITVGKKE